MARRVLPSHRDANHWAGGSHIVGVEGHGLAGDEADGEKTDVFASALILLAIYANDNFSNRGDYENTYSPYEYFVEKRNLRRYWKELGLSPT
jgi:hypothetical protein